MKYIRFIRLARPLSICLLGWLSGSGTLKAQCYVYFSYCPGDITITDCDDSGYEAIDWPMPVAATYGGCTNFNIQQVSGPAPGTLVASPGIYTVSYTATAVDMATGKKSKAGCTITIHLEQDNTPPMFTYCPPDITLYTGNGLTAPGLWSTPIAEDNCGEVTVKTKTPCNTELSPGVHQIIYKAVDAAGNVSYCVFNVTVIQGFQKPAVYSDQANDRGTDEQTAILLAPNPFRDQFVLVRQEFETALNISVFDTRGCQVMVQQWPAEAGTAVLNSGDLTPGVYHIKVSTPDGAFVSALRGIKM
ncbi:MAG: HYR domain-containing protein [Saprospiraceae bacterium]